MFGEKCMSEKEQKIERCWHIQSVVEHQKDMIFELTKLFDSKFLVLAQFFVILNKVFSYILGTIINFILILLLISQV